MPGPVLGQIARHADCLLFTGRRPVDLRRRSPDCEKRCCRSVDIGVYNIERQWDACLDKENRRSVIGTCTDDGSVDHEPARRAMEGEMGRATSAAAPFGILAVRSEEHTSELQSLMRKSYAVFCLQIKNKI